MAHHRIIDTAAWPRRDHFTFYRQFANPSFNRCVLIAAQRLYKCVRDRRVLFFQLALHALLRAANGISQLRQRMRSDEVIEYGNLAIMTPVMIVGEGLCQVRCNNASESTTFNDTTTPKIVAVREITPTPLIVDGEHFICASCLPWFHSTSMTHAEYAVGTVVPALTWGKLQNGVILVAGRFNHAFVDGLHASRSFALVGEEFSDPERFWQPLTETAPLLLTPAAKKR